MTVHLVGAGPGDADLLTVRAHRLLSTCDVVVHDRLIDPSVLALANPRAERIDVGKHPGCSGSQALINSLLISLGREHDSVVRLKGGDPFVFGRGGEEFLALSEAGVPCQVVPGISSAFSAPLLGGVPVTHRGLSHGVTVVTGHAMAGTSVDFTALANPDITLVVLMGVHRRAEIANELIAGGLHRSTPIAIVERASMPGQRVERATLAELGQLEVASPAVMIIGAVAALELSSNNDLADLVQH